MLERGRLIYAAREGSLEHVRQSLDSKPNLDEQDELGYSALMYAAQRGRKEVVQMLLDRNARVDQASQSHLFFGQGYSALSWAAQNGHKEIVQMLLNKKAAINHQTLEDHDTPLILAAYKGHMEVVQTLLDNNAAVDQQNIHGKTALTYAYEQGHNEIAKYIELYKPKAQKMAFLQASTSAEQKYNSSAAARFFNDPICDRHNLPKLIFEYGFTKSKNDK